MSPSSPVACTSREGCWPTLVLIVGSPLATQRTLLLPVKVVSTGLKSSIGQIASAIGPRAATNSRHLVFARVDTLSWRVLTSRIRTFPEKNL